jgi:hypothetical protein
MIKERKPYSVIGFKVDQLSVLLGNLNVHINQLEEIRNGGSPVELRALKRYLKACQADFIKFKKLVNNLEEVKDGLV